MSDIVDNSNVIVEMFTEAAVSIARQDHFINRDGRCLFCDEEINPIQLFCDLYCRDDWEKEQRVLKISGSK